MIFDNVPSSIWLVFVYCFIGGFLLFVIINLVIWKRNPIFRKAKRKFEVILMGSLLCALGFALILTTILGSGLPTVITINKDYSHTEELSCFNDNKFIGISGSYIVNKSNSVLLLRGISEDNDINILIRPGEMKKTRKCPEEYFNPIPDRQHVTTVYVRGKRRVRAGNTTFLVKANDYGYKE